MKIIVSQQGKKLLIEFFYSDAPTKRAGGRSPNLNSDGTVGVRVGVDKADNFLAAIDKFIKKRKMDIKVFKKTDLKFVNTGILTERIIKAIIAGLRF